MFRPSQALLLKLKTLSIHQQLPLNARDSRQLLNILKASFRNHLDEQHWKGEVESFIKTGNEGVSNPVRRRSKSDPERQNHAERHMHSVLTSPLFNISPISKGKSHEAIRDPLETFERALALGLMNLDAANACLLAKKSQILRSSILNVQDGMRHSGAGRKVLRWLISSGNAQDLGFLKHKSFIQTLMEFVVSEDLQGILWNFVQESFDGVSLLSGKQVSEASNDISWPLFCLIKTEISMQGNFDAAIQHLSRAVTRLEELPVNITRVLLGHPLNFIIQSLKHHTRTEKAALSETNHENLLQFASKFRRRPQFDVAYLTLLHPTKPDAKKALHCLRLQAVRLAATEKADSEVAARNWVMLGLDTANFLFQRQQITDAEWVVEFLQKNFPRQLGSGKQQQLEQAQAEAASLELLEGLCLS